jgi:hypothetical protein
MSWRSDGGGQAGVLFERWNRRIHYFLGLYFLLFLWLFSFTGLLLNHPRWAISSIPNNASAPYERPIAAPSGITDLERAQDILGQLGLEGEIEVPQAQQATGRLDFNVAYPKHAAQIRVDLSQMRATVQQVDRSFWSAFRIMHTFSGSRYNAPGSRDWLLTTIWAFAMDGFSIGLLVMVFGSYYMWYRLKAKRTLGWIALSAGCFSTALFVFGLS